VALLYVDSSALVKLVLDEPQSAPLRAYLADADLVACELVLTEVPRAVRRATSLDAGLPANVLLTRTGQVLASLALLPLERPLLVVAGGLDEPSLRILDAIHIAAAVVLSPIDAFVSYDDRQSSAARLAGLRTLAPGS
jgi:predicted nucleic acid-binding protein